MSKMLEPNELANSETLDKGKYARMRIEEFLLQPNNIARLKIWHQKHPGERPPVFYVEQGDKVIWLDRKQLRKMKRAQAKAQRKPALSSHREGLSSSPQGTGVDFTPFLNPASEAKPQEEAADEPPTPATSNGADQGTAGEGEYCEHGPRDNDAGHSDNQI